MIHAEHPSEEYSNKGIEVLEILKAKYGFNYIISRTRDRFSVKIMAKTFYNPNLNAAISEATIFVLNAHKDLPDVLEQQPEKDQPKFN